MAELPADLQEILEVEAARPGRRRSWPHARHQITYTYGQTVLADLAVDGPLPIPAAGQVITVHGVSVKVLDVLLSYGTDADGAPCVWVTARVDSAGLFPGASDPGSGT